MFAIILYNINVVERSDIMKRRKGACTNCKRYASRATRLKCVCYKYKDHYYSKCYYDPCYYDYCDPCKCYEIDYGYGC